jgi:hypothetical protein
MGTTTTKEGVEEILENVRTLLVESSRDLEAATKSNEIAMKKYQEDTRASCGSRSPSNRNSRTASERYSKMWTTYAPQLFLGWPCAYWSLIDDLG